jgi:hypothetical protein
LKTTLNDHITPFFSLEPLGVFSAQFRDVYGPSVRIKRVLDILRWKVKPNQQKLLHIYYTVNFQHSKCKRLFLTLLTTKEIRSLFRWLFKGYRRRHLNDFLKDYELFLVIQISYFLYEKLTKTFLESDKSLEHIFPSFFK